MANDKYVERIVLTLHFSGVTSYLPASLLAENEWNRRASPRVILTNQNLPWDPNSSSYKDQENTMYNYCGKFVRSDPATRVLIMEINQITAITCNDTIEFTDDHNFANILEYTVNINISKISSSNNGYENI